MMETIKLSQDELSETNPRGSPDTQEGKSPDLETPTPCLLFVDDDERTLNMLSKSYADTGWSILTANCGEDGLQLLSQHRVDVVVSDGKMPGMDGIKFLAAVVKEHPDIVCLLMSGYMDLNNAIDAINTGHIYGYIVKPWRNQELKLTIYEALQKKRKQDRERNYHIQAEVSEQKLRKALNLLKEEKRENLTSHQATVRFGSKLLELRCNNDGRGDRVANIASALGEKLGLDNKLCKEVGVAALLCDIGQIWLTDRELTHPYKDLSKLEQLNFKKHPEFGEALVRKFTPFKEAAVMIRGHHERFNGSGYPDRQSGAEIPIGARLLSISSDFDDLIQDRESGFSLDAACDYIGKYAGTRYDPEVVDIFPEVIRADSN